MENDVQTIVLNDESGKEQEFDVITKLDIEEKEYVIVIPSNADEDVQPIALKIEKDENEEDVLISVDEDDEFEMISEAYEALFSENKLN